MSFFEKLFGVHKIKFAMYIETRLKQPLKNRQSKDLHDRW